MILPPRHSQAGAHCASIHPTARVVPTRRWRVAMLAALALSTTVSAAGKYAELRDVKFAVPQPSSFDNFNHDISPDQKTTTTSLPPYRQIQQNYRILLDVTWRSGKQPPVLAADIISPSHANGKITCNMTHCMADKTWLRTRTATTEVRYRMKSFGKVTPVLTWRFVPATN